MKFIKLTEYHGDKPILVNMEKISHVTSSFNQTHTCMGTDHGQLDVNESVEEIMKLIDHAERPVNSYEEGFRIATEQQEFLRGHADGQAITTN